MTSRPVSALALLLSLPLISPPRTCAAHDRPSGPADKTRSTVYAQHGMACTSEPLATSTALRVLRDGGNAVDAAIAANAVIGVTEPMSSGIGGDLFAIVWDSKTHKLYGLNASGRAPEKATIAYFRSKGLEQIPSSGPLSWSVPGCVDGWYALHSKFGKTPMPDLLAPAIEYADHGYPVSEIIAGYWKGAEQALRKVLTSSACYLPEGHAPKAGNVFRNPGLARTLRLIAQDGRDAYYEGPIAHKIVEYSNHVGGLFSLDDFARTHASWVEPVSTNYRGYDVWELPPNSQGIATLQMLNILEPYDLKKMGFGSPEALHLMIEAKKLAFEDRARFYADPDFAQVPVSALISKPYADTRRKLIDPNHASDHPTHGDPKQADTIYMTVVDGDLNAVSLIQSNFQGFGSKHVPADLGFALQNRGCLFALDGNHPNRLEPRKRPFHTIIPGFVTKDGKPWFSFGVMGGDMQPQGHVQVLTDLIDFGMDPQEAGDAPRWRHLGSSEPTGEPAQDGGSVVLESGFSPEVRQALEKLGHHLIDESRGGGFGGYQGIRINPKTRVLSGGSDPRKDGHAAGY